MIARLALAAAVVALCAAGPAGAADLAALGLQGYDSPRPAPALALPGLDGTVTRLEDLRGKVVLLFFWATW